MIKNFDEFTKLNESVCVQEQNPKMQWQSGVDATETPADGTYDGEICGCVMTLDGKDYNLECGPRAHFKGPFRVEDGYVYMMPGTRQYMGQYNGEIQINKPETGDCIASVQCLNEKGRWCRNTKKEV